jgi:hypothetical protein
MKSDEEIRAEVIDYWNQIVDSVKESFEDNFKKLASLYQMNITSGIPSIGGISGNDFCDYVNSDYKNILCAINEVQFPDYLSLDDKYIDYIAICDLFNCDYNEAKNLIIDIFEGRPKNYEKFINENQLYSWLVEFRNKLIKIHRQQKKILPRVLSVLIAKQKLLIKGRPKDSKEIFQNTIDQLSYFVKFSDIIIQYLEQDWPRNFDLEPNLSKDFSKQSFWNPIILKCYDIFYNKNCHSHYRSCNLTAQLLGILFPSIWAGDIKKITSRIRKRIDDMNPYLVSSR